MARMGAFEERDLTRSDGFACLGDYRNTGFQPVRIAGFQAAEEVHRTVRPTAGEMPAGRTGWKPVFRPQTRN